MVTAQRNKCYSVVPAFVRRIKLTLHARMQHAISLFSCPARVENLVIDPFKFKQNYQTLMPLNVSQFILNPGRPRDLMLYSIEYQYLDVNGTEIASNV
jgi:hypothetical protein